MTLTQATMNKTKLISETTASEMIIDSYVVQRSIQSCRHCMSVECYTTIFEVWVHPTKTRTTGVRSLRVYTGALKDLPMSIVDLPAREVPTCYDCVETFECHGQKPIPPASRLAWEETLRRKYTPEPTTRTPAEKHVPSLESL